MSVQESDPLIPPALEPRSRLRPLERNGRRPLSGTASPREEGFFKSIARAPRPVIRESLPSQGERGELSFRRKTLRECASVAAIAATAAGLVRPRSSVFVDSDAIAFETGLRLLQGNGLTIFTNSVRLLNERPAHGCRLLSLGGELRLDSLALVGAEFMEEVCRLRFDFAFLGTSGIDAESGPCTNGLGEAGVKTAVIDGARRAILLADAPQWARSAPIRFADWPQIDEVITDHEATPREESVLASNGVTLRHVVA